MNTLTRFVLLAAGCAAAGAAFAQGGKQYEVLQSNLSPDLQRVTLRLEATVAGSDQERNARSRGSYESEDVPPRFARRVGASYQQYVYLGEVAGKTYHAFTRPADMRKSLARNTPEFIDLLVLAEPAGGRRAPEKVLEGWLTLGNEVLVPLREKITPVGSNGVTDLIGSIALTFNSRNAQRLGGSVEVRSRLSAQGAQVIGSTKLTVTLTPIVDVPASPSQPWSASIALVEPGTAPKSAAGALRDPLTVGSAKIVAEKIAKDFSEIVVAVLDGDLGKWEVEQKRQIDELPDLARVEFFGRRLVTRDDLLSAAADTGHVVLVFGEMPLPNNPYMGGPGPSSPALTLGIKPVMDTLGRDLEKPSPVVFVVRMVSLRDLFEEYLDKQPPYLLLADYADAMTSQFIGIPGPYYMPYYSGQPARKSLRADMGLADNSVAVVVVDKTGKIKYFKGDAGGDLRGALLGANKVLRAE